MDYAQFLAGLSQQPNSQAYQAPDVSNMLSTAQALRNIQPVQGQMVGPYYAAPPKSAGWLSVADNLIATLAENHARTVDQKYKSQLAAALSSQNPTDALSQMAQSNPYAQQLVLSQALKGAPKPNWTKVDKQTPQGVQTGFVDTNSQDPTSTFRPLGQTAPKQPEMPGMLIQDANGQWVPNPTYIQAKKDIGAALSLIHI